jgi:hypothetical protein
MAALCCNCTRDEYLRKIIDDGGAPLLCDSCGEEIRNAISADQLAEIVGPVIRANFEVACQLSSKSAGGPLIVVLGEVLVCETSILEELEAALIASDVARLKHGEYPFFSANERYMRKPTDHRSIFYNWQHIEQELKHRQRFFSQVALAYFKRIFQRIDEFRDGWNKSVVLECRAGTELYRARSLRKHSTLDQIFLFPGIELGPPPTIFASAGRMNADGVAVFYGAFSLETCIAEMRPTLASLVVVGTFRTTQRLRILDFSALAQSGPEEETSFFDPDGLAKREADEVLRRIHGLIARPIQPGEENSEFIITQSIAEYLAHIQDPPLDGVIFNSVQYSGGKNIVIFSQFGRGELLQDEREKCFPVEYVDKSVRLFKTTDITYRNEEVSLNMINGKVYTNYYDEYHDDDFPY